MTTRTTLTLILGIFGLMLLGLLWSQGFPSYRNYVVATERIALDAARHDLLGALLALQQDHARIAAMKPGPARDTAPEDMMVTPIKALRKAADTLSGQRDPELRTLVVSIEQEAERLSALAATLAAATALRSAEDIDAALAATDRAKSRLVEIRGRLLTKTDSADPIIAGLQLVGNALLAVNHAFQLDRALLLRDFSDGAIVHTGSVNDAENSTAASRAAFSVLLGTIKLFDKAAAEEIAGLLGFLRSTYEPAEAIYLQALSTGHRVDGARDAWQETAGAFDRMVEGVRRHVFAQSQAHYARQKSAALADLEARLLLSAAVFVLFSVSLFTIDRLILRPIVHIYTKILDLLAGDMTPKPVERFTLRDLHRMSDAVRVFRVEAVRRERMSRDQMLLHEKIAEAHKSLKADMRAAAKVQVAQLPEPGEIGNVRFSTFFEAAQEVAGDTFDYLPISEHRVGLFQVDVAGHGAAAGLVSVAAHIGARRALRKLKPGDSLAAAIAALNAGWSPDQTYFTMVAIELDAEHDQGRLVQAGHPHPVLMRANGTVSRLGQGGLPIGVVPDAAFEDTAFPFAAGDRLFVFSDGLYENMNDREEFFTEARFIDLLQAQAGCDTDTLVARVGNALKAWCGPRAFSDDVSLVVAERI